LNTKLREKILAALAKPSPESVEDNDASFFDPWDDVITGIYGSYASESDYLMIRILEAARDGQTFDVIKGHGFAAEFMLYVLAGHGLLEYGTSPRGGWPDPDVADLWQSLIDKWKAYARAVWGRGSFEEAT